jgi:Anti-sigma factor NepR
MTKRGAQRPPGTGEAAEGTEKEQPANAKRAAAAFPMHEHIGRGLRNMFDEVVNQPVPDKLRELLEELERKQTKS